jgi:hypothetical protein
MRCLAAAALSMISLPGYAQTYNLSVNSNNAERCADQQGSSSNGAVARAADSVTLGAAEPARRR